MEPGRITARQIAAARRAITRHIKRQGRLWIRIFPDVPVSSKPAEVRMGSGKGSPEFWVARVKPGRILFALDGVAHSSEEHTSELQSLMRISYAVFCLKTKNTLKQTQHKPLTTTI